MICYVGLVVCFARLVGIGGSGTCRTMKEQLLVRNGVLVVKKLLEA